MVDMQTKSEPQENLRLQIKRVIKASRQQVFDAWTRPETIRLWFNPGATTMIGASINADAGGEYRFTMTGNSCVDGEPLTAENSVVTGRYVRVEPYDLLAFTWRSPRFPAEESLVTIELKDVEGGTEMTLTHDRFHTVESRDQHFNGWSNVVPKLAEFFERN
jgi:uncharacterized protein YndB with AHSA1/START domain